MVPSIEKMPATPEELSKVRERVTGMSLMDIANPEQQRKLRELELRIRHEEELAALRVEARKQPDFQIFDRGEPTFPVTPAKLGDHLFYDKDGVAARNGGYSAEEHGVADRQVRFPGGVDLPIKKPNAGFSKVGRLDDAIVVGGQTLGGETVVFRREDGPVQEASTLLNDTLRQAALDKGELIQVKALHCHATLPTRNNPTDAGLDLYASEDVGLNVGEPVKVKTGIAMAIPRGYVGMICDRSGMGARGIRVLGGIIDADYRGELMVVLINLNRHTMSKCPNYEVKAGDRIAQMVILPCLTPAVLPVENLDETDRGIKGFGSSGL